jgi:hypothetical protein
MNQNQKLYQNCCSNKKKKTETKNKLERNAYLFN